MVRVDDLVSRVKSYHPGADEELVRKAYAYAEKAHEGQKRKSGDPYFVHPTRVAGVLADLKLDVASVCAGLLHDVIEDTLATKEDMAREFGTEIAELVDGVTKLSQINFVSKEDRQAENFRKMVVAMSKDIRVLLVKLSDRLDNMRTLEHMKPESQERIARETMEIYAPLANRLGMQSFKIELEDASFKFLEPEAYQTVAAAIAKKRSEREAYVEDVVRQLSARLAEDGFRVDISGRAKHLYSVWRKMKDKGLSVDEIYDIIAFRVLVPSVGDCYAALGIVHSKWTPIPGRFKDYIALPKPNGYRSLHTTIIGPRRDRIEIQIRTEEMHSVAEKGIAAHWRYKERNAPGGVSQDTVNSFGWLRQLMQWQTDLKDPAEFLESVKVDLFQEEVYVFTPKGDVRVFPKGATPLDFAYQIHTELGHKTTGARIGGKFESLRYKLRSGDVVEIVTQSTQKPGKDWLDFVVTSSARSKIRVYLRQEQRDKSLRIGRELLERDLVKAGLSMAKWQKSDHDVRRVVEALKVHNLEELFVSIGYGRVDAHDVVELLAPKKDGVDMAPPSALREGTLRGLVRKAMKQVDDGGIRLGGIDDLLVRHPKCCNPLPGDDIVGFVSRGRGLTIHRKGCQKALDTDPERRVEISWDSNARIDRAVNLRVVTANKPGILATISQTFSKEGINISEANCRVLEEGKAVNNFKFTCSDLNQLKSVTRALQKLTGVVSVDRA